MKRKTPYSAAAAHRAIVLQALFASVGKDAPSIGQVLSFVNKWGRAHKTVYQCQLELNHLESEGCIGVSFRNHGKMKIRTYHLTPSGAIMLVAMTEHLPAQIRKAMGEVYARAAAAAEAVLLEGVNGDNN